MIKNEPEETDSLTVKTIDNTTDYDGLDLHKGDIDLSGDEDVGFDNIDDLKSSILDNKH